MKLRRALQVLAVLLLFAFAVMVWFYLSGRSVVSQREGVQRGEEVYASHDCTDCHLAAHILKQKREKNEVGLIRVRKNAADLVQFLSSDERHKTFVMISAGDRDDLIAYLRNLVMTAK